MASLQIILQIVLMSAFEFHVSVFIQKVVAYNAFKQLLREPRCCSALRLFVFNN